MNDRLSFMAGLGALSLMALTGEAGAKDELFNAEYIGVLTRTVMDTERIVFKTAFEKDISLRGQINVYQFAAEAIKEDGLDPFANDFWERVTEYIKRRTGDNTEALDLSELHGIV